MVSTYFSYSYITRNLKQSLTRVEQQQDVAREAAYYKAHIGKVKSVDDFMKDYRLYHYATKAYGLEDMAYAKAFMKKVLESDLSDANSFVNQLVDKRYREFAAAFSFNGQCHAGGAIGEPDRRDDWSVHGDQEKPGRCTCRRFELLQRRNR
ncbi:hypothetical protein ACVWZV_005870 [Bradyrhizobium sp. GM5.1]